MIKYSPPHASRGRRTLALALGAFVFAGGLTVLGRLASTMPDRVSLDPVDTPDWTPVRSVAPDSLSSRAVADTAKHVRPIAPTADLTPSLRLTRFDSVRTGASQAPVRNRTTGGVMVLLILGVGTLFAWWLKRSKVGAPQQSISTIGRLSMQHGQELRLIRVRNEEMLVGATQNSITLLHRFDSVSANGCPDVTTTKNGTSRKGFGTLLRTASESAGVKASGREPESTESKVTVNV